MINICTQPTQNLVLPYPQSCSQLEATLPEICLLEVRSYARDVNSNPEMLCTVIRVIYSAFQDHLQRDQLFFFVQSIQQQPITLTLTLTPPHQMTSRKANSFTIYCQLQWLFPQKDITGLAVQKDGTILNKLSAAQDILWKQWVPGALSTHTGEHLSITRAQAHEKYPVGPRWPPVPRLLSLWPVSLPAPQKECTLYSPWPVSPPAPQRQCTLYSPWPASPPAPQRQCTLQSMASQPPGTPKGPCTF